MSRIEFKMYTTNLILILFYISCSGYFLFILTLYRHKRRQFVEKYYLLERKILDTILIYSGMLLLFINEEIPITLAKAFDIKYFV